MQFKVPFIKPSFPSSDQVADDYSAIIESNWFTNFGPFEKKFVKEAAEYIGDTANIASVSNATLGLFIAINILFKTSEKKKVLVPSFTFAAGPEMLILSGLTPVLFDIDKDTWQPNIDQAKAYLKSNSEKVAGILLCNIFGVGNPIVDQWELLAAEYGVPLVIDSAAGFGSKYSEEEKIGLRGDCEIFSLHATKPFAVGEGGLITSKSSEFIEKVKLFENFGFDSDKRISTVGINAKLQELNAAIGLRQLDQFDQRLTSRRRSLYLYKQKLQSIECSFQYNDNLSTVPFVSVVLEDKTVADDALIRLKQSGIEARKYYEPLHTQTVLVQNSETAGPLQVTEDIYSRIISLPLHDSMNEESIQEITDIIIQVYNEYLSR